MNKNNIMSTVTTNDILPDSNNTMKSSDNNSSKNKNSNISIKIKINELKRKCAYAPEGDVKFREPIQKQGMADLDFGVKKLKPDIVENYKSSKTLQSTVIIGDTKEKPSVSDSDDDELYDNENCHIDSNAKGLTYSPSLKKVAKNNAGESDDSESDHSETRSRNQIREQSQYKIEKSSFGRENLENLDQAEKRVNDKRNDAEQFVCDNKNFSTHANLSTSFYDAKLDAEADLMHHNHSDESEYIITNNNNKRNSGIGNITNMPKNIKISDKCKQEFNCADSPIDKTYRLGTKTCKDSHQFNSIASMASEKFCKSYDNKTLNSLANRCTTDFDNKRSDILGPNEGCASTLVKAYKISNIMTEETVSDTSRHENNTCSHIQMKTNTCKDHLEMECNRNFTSKEFQETTALRSVDLWTPVDFKYENKLPSDSDEYQRKMTLKKNEQALCFKSQSLVSQTHSNTTNQNENIELSPFLNGSQDYPPLQKENDFSEIESNEHHSYEMQSHHLQIQQESSTSGYSHMNLQRLFQQQEQHQQNGHQQQGYEHVHQQQQYNCFDIHPQQHQRDHQHIAVQHCAQEQLFQHHLQHQPKNHHLEAGQHISFQSQIQSQLQLELAVQQQQGLQQNHQQELLYRQNDHTHILPYRRHHPPGQNRLLHQQQLQGDYQYQHLQSAILLSSHQEHQQLLSNHISAKHTNLPPSIDDLIIDEFQDDPSTSYKLALSPTNVKHENQDDGYETSAGDVLTPNSLSSSLHSVAPQHQTSQAIEGLAFPTKCKNLKNQQVSLKINSVEMIQQEHQQQRPDTLSQNINEELIERIKAGTNIVTDQYSLTKDNLVSLSSNVRQQVRCNLNTNCLSTSDDSNGLIGQSKNIFGIQTQQQASTTATETNIHHQQQQIQLQENINKYESNSLTGEEQLEQSFLDDSVLIMTNPLHKRRGRKKKCQIFDNVTVGPMFSLQQNAAPSNTNILNENTAAAVLNVTAGIHKSKVRKKHDRFNGMSQEEVVKRRLPDHLCDNLDIVIVGINPGLFAAYKGHHYAGPGNHFWKCLYLSGLTQEQMSADEDYKLMKNGIGFTNMVQRATKGSADLTRKEIKEGSRNLLEKLRRFRPKIAVFNGKLIFEVFSGKKDFNFGRQPECVEGTKTYIWVMPSSSARCAQLPRAADKVPFYEALKKFRDYLNGIIPHIDESECIFSEQRIKQCCDQQESLKLLSSTKNVITHQPGSVLQYRNMQYTMDATNSSLTQQQLTNEECNLSKNNNLMQQSTSPQFRNSHESSYMYEADKNLQVGGNASGPVPTPSSALCSSLPQHIDDKYLTSYHQIPEKKKRGRPKKIKAQDVLDLATVNKTKLRSHLPTSSNNILNLSVTNGANKETQKKKRGRPKKLKPPSEIVQQQDRVATQENHIAMSTQTSFTNNDKRQQTHYTAYGTTSPNLQQRIYNDFDSPLRSHSLNFSYTKETPVPPTHQQQCNVKKNKTTNNPLPSGSNTDLVLQHVSDESNNYYKSNNAITSAASVAAAATLENSTNVIAASGRAAKTITNEHHLVESSPPSSPNICAVDFEPPTGDVASSVNHNELQEKKIQQGPQILAMHKLIQPQSYRYSNPVHEIPSENQASGHFQQWMPPQHAQIATTQFTQHHHQQLHFQAQALHYVDQHFQHNLHQHTHVTLNAQPQWYHRHMRYEDSGSQFMLSSQHHQKLHQQHSHTQHVTGTEEHSHVQQSTYTQVATDVANTSLSGLESLVDQIPTLPQSETVAMQTVASSVGAEIVESHLQGLENQQSIQRMSVASVATEVQQPDKFCSPTNSTPAIVLETSDTVGGNSRGSNTPHTISSLYGRASSPSSYTLTRHSTTTSATSSLNALSSHQQQHHQQNHQHQQYHHTHQQYNVTSTAQLTVDTKPLPGLSPEPGGITLLGSRQTDSMTEHDLQCIPPISVAAKATVGPGSKVYQSSSSSLNSSNFSVSNLAESSATTNSSNTISENYSSLIPPNAYHHSNIMAVAALTAAVHSPSNLSTKSSSATPHVAHPQTYMDRQAPVNSMFPTHHYPPNPSYHQHPAHTAHHLTSTYGPIQQTVATEYGSLYGIPTARSAVSATVSQNNTAHTLHMPSPNYPYCYGTQPAQSNYGTSSVPPGAVSAAAAVAVAAAAVAGYHQHNPHHGHPHAHSHATHHLSVFERIKPSDIGYSGH